MLRPQPAGVGGVIPQQMANQLGAGYDTGMFTSLTGAALDMSFARYAPTGGTDATLNRDQVTLHIDAPPEAVYALLADVTRTPEFSPEILRCRWLDGATGPAAGARFEAVNKIPADPRGGTTRSP